MHCGSSSRWKISDRKFPLVEGQVSNLLVVEIMSDKLQFTHLSAIKSESSLLLLLDGLDEVTSQARRVLVKWISNNLMYAAGIRYAIYH